MTSLASCTKIAKDNRSSSVARLFVTTHPWVSTLSLWGHLSEARLPGIQGLGPLPPGSPSAAPVRCQEVRCSRDGCDSPGRALDAVRPCVSASPCAGWDAHPRLCRNRINSLLVKCFVLCRKAAQCRALGQSSHQNRLDTRAELPPSPLKFGHAGPGL